MLEFSLNKLSQFVIMFMLVNKCLTISSAVFVPSLSRSYVNGFCRFGSFHRYVGFQNLIIMYCGINKISNIRENNYSNVASCNHHNNLLTGNY